MKRQDWGLLALLALGAGAYFFLTKKNGVGAFATTTCPTGTVSLGTGQCYDYNSGQVFYPSQIYQYQQQYYPYQQQQQQYYDPYQYQYQQPSYSAYYPQYYQQQQQYYYPYQQQYTSPTYQYQQYTQPQQNLSSCISTCMQMYQY